MSFLKFKQKEKIKLRAVCSSCGKFVSSKQKSTASLQLLSKDRCHCIINTTEPKSARHHKVEHAEFQASTNVVAPIDLGERYEVLSLIGEGGMGAVYKVKDKILDKSFAIKILRPELTLDALAVKRFEQEAQASATLTHPNLVAVYSHGLSQSSAPYLVMDYLEGESLENLLKKDGHLSVPRALDLFMQICEALSHAHTKGIIHRDLKPSNVIVTKTEEGHDLVKIVDFGIAKALASVNDGATNLTRTGDLFGSPLYMSPEQCTGEKVDARSDIYSLGCVMYEALTGKPPFAAANPFKTMLKQVQDSPPGFSKTASNLNLSGDLEKLVLRCLEKDPASRYQSADDLRMDLEHVREGRKPRKEEQLLIPEKLDCELLAKRSMAAFIDASVLGMAFALLQFLIFGFGMFMVQATLHLHSTAWQVLASNEFGFGACVLGFSKVGLLLGFMESLVPCCTLLFAIALVCPALGNDGAVFPQTAALSMCLLAIIIGSIILNWLYHAILESSAMHATVGKRLVGLALATRSGHRPVSFKQASLRHFAKILWTLNILGTEPFWMLGRHSNKQQKLSDQERFRVIVQLPLHDRLSGCAVVKQHDKEVE